MESHEDMSKRMMCMEKACGQIWDTRENSSERRSQIQSQKMQKHTAPDFDLVGFSKLELMTKLLANAAIHSLSRVSEPASA